MDIHTIAQVYRAVVRPEFALKGDPNRVVAVKVCVLLIYGVYRLISAYMRSSCPALHASIDDDMSSSREA
jgi:hypothetical protein